MKEIVTKRKLREFGFLVGFVFPLIIGWLLPAIFGHGFRVWTLFIGLPAFIMGLTSPLLLHYPYKIWIALGNALGWINSNIILGLIFIGVLLPIAFFMRLTNYDPLKTKLKGEKTYRENRQNHQTDLTRIF